MRALILAGLLLMPLPATAVPGGDAASARSFLQSIYAYYKKGSYGAPMKRPERWFEPRLAAAIRADDAEADRKGDIPKLEADPFCDCQDFEALTATIDEVSVADGKASAKVRFDNGGPISMRYSLVWTKAGWRVFDIEWEEGGLREMYFPPAGQP